MGLDNGIVAQMKEGVPPLKFADANGDICYWRKCWGIREAIIRILDPKGLNSNNARYNIDAEDIPAIIRALRPFFSKEYWDENAESIWEFDEIFESLIDDILHLSELKHIMDNSNDIECVYFYDSY